MLLREVVFEDFGVYRGRQVIDLCPPGPGRPIILFGGFNGAGKTTLVNLVPRFYEVTGGVIRIDGIDIRDVTRASLRSQIGIVTQDTVLFDDTIGNNIAYASPVASHEMIESAARAAHLRSCPPGLCVPEPGPAPGAFFSLQK